MLSSRRSLKDTIETYRGQKEYLIWHIGRLCFGL
jgi:hypothetical protein